MSNMLATARNQFLEFFKSKQHMIIDSAPLVPENDPTLLFVNSGMAPLKRYFLQEDTPPHTRLVNSQRCLRVGGKHNDLADVGYTKRHHTFFEMLGNFSFGDYFQKEVIPFAWEFLTQTLKLDPARLYITVHPDDADAFEIWKTIVDESRITKLEENVWSMGEIGPFGYCSEIFYDLETGEGDVREGDRYLEIWNLVFMKFYCDGKTKTTLPKPCIDAGMGLERIVSVLEGVNDTYDIEFFKQALPILGLKAQTTDSKIFLDHLRSSAFMISEGIMPSASNRGYILRRLIRRGLKSFFTFNLELEQIARKILTQWAKSYDYKLDLDKVCKTLNEEAKQFSSIIENGTQMFEEIFAEHKHFDAAALFLLHDTYGFSIDITIDLLKARGGTCDLAGFEQLMEESKESSRKKAMNILLPFPATEYIDEYHTGQYTLDANILGFHEDYVILDSTPFYAEGGGQVGDTGFIEGKGFKLQIVDTKKLDKVFIHKFIVLSGCPELGPVKATIDNARRAQIRAHHSATHLLHQALCNILGDHVQQMGSLVCEDRLRLDFTHAHTITQDEINKIEDIVNNWVQENHAAQIEQMEYKAAVAAGAKAFFTYDSTVRTVKFGNESFELCGGSHVHATGDIGMFKILKISAISAGTKRIEACCAKACVARVQKTFAMLKDIAHFLNVDEESIIQKLENVNKKTSAKNTKIEMKMIGKWHVGYCQASNVEIENQMKQHKLDAMLICEDNGDKLSLQLKLAPDAAQTLDAKQIMQELGVLVGAAGCGGRKDFAQTGGKNVENKDKLFLKLCQILENWNEK